ncbi:MAG TPA: BTAD domain-containing putative transcriptional regulator [Gemmatimonadaceae bacterium]|nr:BTAD domain-containing putative transcriptional regulator [Gemmatimonadaceae bacterium]
MIDLRVLGTLDLRDSENGRPILAILAQPKRMALLIYLALATPRGSHRRETLLLMFWPDSTEDRARNSLNQAVFNLRRVLGEAAVVGTGEELRLSDEVVRCDAVEFDRVLTASDAEGALRLYGGDLVPGFHVDDCIEFERWLDDKRQQLRAKAVAAAIGLAQKEERSEHSVAAVELLRRAALWAPYDEPAVTRLVALLARLGDRPGALREYDRFRSLLQADLAITPSAELDALVAEIRRGEVAAAYPVGAPGRREAAGADASRLPDIPSRPEGSAARIPAWRSGMRLRAAAAAVLLAIGAGAVVLARQYGKARGPAATPLDTRRVLVAAFENRTGDRALDPLGYMAADWITQGLARTGLARVVPFSTVVQETPHLTAEGSAPEVAIPTANRQLARRIGAGILITGAYYRGGDSLAFQGQIVDVATGEVLRAIEGIRGSTAQPAAAVEQLQRRTLGTLATLFDQRLTSWPDVASQPSSLEAYQLFSDGMDLFLKANRDFGTSESRRLYGEAAASFVAAAQTDSAFATPLLWAVYAYMNARDSAAADSLIRSLERQPLSTWNRAVLNHQLALLSRNAEAQYGAARELAELSPDSEWLLKLGVAAFDSNRPGIALDVFMRINPDRGWIKEFPSYWRLRSELQHITGNYSAGLKDTRRGQLANPGDTWLRTLELWALAALGRDNEILELLAPRLAAGDAFAAWQLTTAVEELRGHGHRRASRRIVQWSLPLVELLRDPDGRPSARRERAYLLNEAGRTSEARVLYRALAAERPEEGEYRVRSALLAAREGDQREAVETLNWLGTLRGADLGRVVPRSELRYWGSAEGWHAVMQARLLAQTGNPERAVETLRVGVSRGLKHTYLHLHDDPEFDPLRRHAGFQQLLRSKD